MNDLPWDQRLARVLVGPLVNTPVHPNVLTATGLVMGLTAADSIFPGRTAGCPHGIRHQARRE